MRTSIDCIPCFMRQTLEAVRMVTDERAVHEEVIRKVLNATASMDFTLSPPQMGQTIHRLIREASGKEDPYYEIKKRCNHLALDLYPELKKNLNSSSDRFETSVRLAIAGNIIDFGVTGRFNEDSIHTSIRESLVQPLNKRAVEVLRDSIEVAKNILYIGDNAGEIVFDRILIEEMPIEKVTFAVRGFPIINDATKDDAEETGLSSLVEVIDNGSDVPGTVLKECSQEFRNYFAQSDLIIAKGQGNYETLSEECKNICYLFKAKCPVIAKDSGCNVGDMVIVNKRCAFKAQSKKSCGVELVER